MIEREWIRGNNLLVPGAVLRLWQHAGRWHAALCGLDLWVESHDGPSALRLLAERVRERGPEWEGHARGIDDARENRMTEKEQRK